MVRNRFAGTGIDRSGGGSGGTGGFPTQNERTGFPTPNGDGAGSSPTPNGDGASPDTDQFVTKDEFQQFRNLMDKTFRGQKSSSLNSDIQQNAQRIDDLAQTIQDLDRPTPEISESVETLRSDLDSLKKTVQSVQSQLANRDTPDVSQLRSTVQSLADDVATLEQQTTSTQPQVDEIKTRLSDLESQVQSALANSKSDAGAKKASNSKANPQTSGMGDIRNLISDNPMIAFGGLLLAALVIFR